jgi:hypothetical protein
LDSNLPYNAKNHTHKEIAKVAKNNLTGKVINERGLLTHDQKETFVEESLCVTLSSIFNEHKLHAQMCTFCH